jgi:DNA topoisomerase IA
LTKQTNDKKVRKLCIKFKLKESRTEAPRLLTEADLISLMEKHGIGKKFSKNSTPKQQS